MIFLRTLSLNTNKVSLQLFWYEHPYIIYLRNFEAMHPSSGAENCHGDSSNKDDAISFGFYLPERECGLLSYVLRNESGNAGKFIVFPG